MKKLKWLLNLVRAGVSATQATTRTTYVHRIMSESPLIVVSSGSEKRDAKKNLKPLVHYKCQMCQLPLNYRLYQRSAVVKSDGICYDCKLKVRNDFRLEDTRTRTRRTGLTAHSQSKKNQKTVFLAVGVFSVRPKIHNICMSVHHQLLCTGSVCKQASCQ